MGVKFGLLHAKFHPHRCNVSPLRGKKPQNRPLSKRNTGRFALRAMLPVTKKTQMRPDGDLQDHDWQERLRLKAFFQLSEPRLNSNLARTAGLLTCVCGGGLVTS